MSCVITAERPDVPAARELIAELDEHLGGRYSIENRYGFSVDKLLRQGVVFFVAWGDAAQERAAGCGGVLFVPATGDDGGFAEIKRMYVRPEFRGMGIGRAVLEHLVGHAREQGYPLLRLETGIYQEEARGLYERMGFRETGPFPPYPDNPPDPVSVFYELRL